MLGGSERFVEARRTVLADLQHAISHAEAPFRTYVIQPLTNGNGDGSRHALGRQLGQLRCRSVSFLVFDAGRPRTMPRLLRFGPSIVRVQARLPQARLRCNVECRRTKPLI